MTEGDIIRNGLQALQDRCHEASYDAGWWHQADSGIPYIPGDAAIIRKENGQRVIVFWNQLPETTRHMIVHYWPIVIACKIGLIHSEISEAMEAHRKSLKDDKLKDRLGLDAEISDAMIRQFDLVGAMNRASDYGVVDPEYHDIQLPLTILEKMAFNKSRPDHQVSVRNQKGGKYY